MGMLDDSNILEFVGVGVRSVVQSEYAIDKVKACGCAR